MATIALFFGHSPAHAVSSEGKPKHYYKLKVEPTTVDGTPVRFPEGSDGWNCAPMASTIEEGTLRNFKGEVKTLTKTTDSEFDPSSGALQLRRFGTDGTSELRMQFEYRCSKRKRNISPSFSLDEKGDSQVGVATSSTTHVQKVVWNCRPERLPTGTESIPLACTRDVSASSSTSHSLNFSDKGVELGTGGPVGFNFGGGFYFAPLLASQAGSSPVSWDQTVLKATLAYSHSVEDFIFDNCTPETAAHRRVIFVSQGLGGRYFEANYKLKVKINGRTEVTIPSNDGIFAQAISYCPNAEERERRLRVEISGVEEDPFFDDVFQAQSVALVGANPGCQSISLRRRTWFGSYFTPRNSSVLLHFSGVNPDEGERQRLYQQVAESNRTVGEVSRCTVQIRSVAGATAPPRRGDGQRAGEAHAPEATAQSVR